MNQTFQRNVSLHERSPTVMGLFGLFFWETVACQSPSDFGENKFEAPLWSGRWLGAETILMCHGFDGPAQVRREFLADLQILVTISVA